MAIGFAASSSVVGLIYSALYHPLPKPLDAVSNVDVYFIAEHSESGVSPPILRALQRQSKSADLVTGYQEMNVQLDKGPDSDPISISAVLVEPEIFSLLNLQPFAGRLLTESDVTHSANDNNLLVSLDFARDHFGSPENAIGKTLRFKKDWRVVGVISSSDYLFRTTQVWMPLSFTPEDEQPQAAAWFDGIRALARLKDGVLASDAEADWGLLVHEQLNTQWVPPSLASDSAVHVTPLRHRWVADQERTLQIMLMTVLLIMVLVGSNVCNLYSVRLTQREHESAIFATLGATAKDRLLNRIVEISLLLGAAVILGLALLPGFKRLLYYFELVPVGTPYSLGIDGATTGCMLTIAATMGLALGVCALVSERRTARIYETLKNSSAGRNTSGSRAQKTRTTLMVVQLAVTFVLFMATGLLVRAAHHLLAVDVGFNRNNLLVSTLNAQADPPTYFASMVSFRDRIRELPGVESASLVDKAPFSKLYSLISFIPPGESEEVQDANQYSSVDSAYFNVLGQKTIFGRGFTEDEARLSADVVIVDSVFAKKFYPSVNPIGKEIRVKPFNAKPDAPLRRVTIVGVVDTIKFDTLDEQPIRPTLYFPGLRGGQIVIRSSIAPGTIVGSLRKVAHEVAPGARLGFATSMNEWIENTIRGRLRLNRLLEFLAAIGIVLAVVGLHAIIAYSATTRLAEFAVRLALGATRTRIRQEIYAMTYRYVGLGVLLGLPVLYLLNKAIGPQLFNTSILDSWTIAMSILGIAFVGTIATWRPAYTAGNVQPATILKSD